MDSALLVAVAAAVVVVVVAVVVATFFYVFAFVVNAGFARWLGVPLGVVGLFTGFGGGGGGAGLATACTMRALVACWLIWFSCSVLSLSNLSLESSAGVGILSLLGLGSVTFWLACSSAVDLRWFILQRRSPVSS